MSFVTHLAFSPEWHARFGARSAVRMIGYPFTSIAGACAIVAILITTWCVEDLRITLVAGVPWLVAITIAYLIVARVRKRFDGAVGAEAVQLLLRA